MVCGNMEVEAAPENFMNDLYDNKAEKVGTAVCTLKNSVIGSQKQKNSIIEQGHVSRLIHILMDPDMNTKIKTDVVYIISSVISGTENSVKCLNDGDLVTLLLQVSLNTLV